MKFAFCLFKYFPYGGLQRDFLHIATTCLERGHEVDVYTQDWQGPSIDGLNVFHITGQGNSSHKRCESFSEQCQQHFLDKPYDAVVGFNKIAGLDVYFAADVCFRAKQDSRRYLAKYISRYQTFIKLEQAVFAPHSATEILYIAEPQKQGYQESYGTPDSRFHFVTTGIDTSQFHNEEKTQIRQHIRQQFNIDEQQTLLLAIGTGFKAKGLDRSLHAIASLPTALREKSVFLIAGQGPQRQFERLCQKLQIEKQVHFLGGRDDTPDLLMAADFLLHPAYLESGGIVLLEALLSGLPILTTDGSGFSHHVKHAEAGLVLPHDAEQIVFNQALQTLLTSDKKQQWQRNGLRYAETHDFSSLGRQATDLIESVAQRRPKAQHMLSTKQCCKNLTTEIRADFYKTMPPQTLFSDINAITGDMYRDIDNRQTLRFEKENQAYFIKRHQGIGWSEIFKNLAFFRWPILGAKQEFLAIRRLEALKIDTMQVVAYGKQGWNPAKQQSFLITEALENTISLEDFCRPWAQQAPNCHLKWALIKKIAEIARTLHDNGLNHRDFYICHFLLHLSDDTEHHSQPLKLSLIDLHRMQQHRRLPQRWRVKDLAGLHFSSMDIGLTKRDILRFLKTYTQKTLHEINWQDTLWQQTEARAQALYNKGV